MVGGRSYQAVQFRLGGSQGKGRISQLSGTGCMSRDQRAKSSHKLSIMFDAKFSRIQRQRSEIVQGMPIMGLLVAFLRDCTFTSNHKGFGHTAPARNAMVWLLLVWRILLV